MSSIIVAMPNAEDLARDIAERTGLPLAQIERHTFPDQETLFRILDPVQGQNVHLVARLNNPDAVVLQLLMLAGGLRQNGANSVKLISPYLPYMRQDIAFRPGEVVSAKVFARLISERFDGLVTIDPHLHRFDTLNALYDIPSQSLSATSEMARWIDQNTASPIIIGPDSESEQWVGKIARALSAPQTTLRKVRHSDHNVDVSNEDLKLDGAQSVVLVDDIISSGSTMLKAAEFIRSHYSDLEIHICAVHCLATRETLDQLKAVGIRSLAASNSVLSPITGFNIAGSIAGAIVANGRINP